MGPRISTSVKPDRGRDSGGSQIVVMTGDQLKGFAADVAREVIEAIKPEPKPKEEFVSPLIRKDEEKPLICHKEMLTMTEAELYTGLSRAMLYKLTSQRRIRYFKPSGKLIFFRRLDLDLFMTENPVAADFELNTKALSYCEKNPNPRISPQSSK